MKTVIIVITVITLSACTTINNVPPQEAKKSDESVPSYQISDVKAIEDIRKLSPRSPVPLTIAVMPGAQELSAKEIEAIEQWGKALKEIGFSERLEIVPKTMVPSCTSRDASNCFFSRSREVGARLGADAILFLSDKTSTDSQANPLSLLNITIIGAWLVPGHHRHSHSIYEASLFGIDNGYLYAVAQGSGEHSILRPLAYADKSIAQRKARLNALADLGQKLTAAAKGIMRDRGFSETQ